MALQSRDERRSAILGAARICFLDRGFVRTTITDILELCGGSRATVYAEFGSKEGLFAALVSEIIAEMKLPDVISGRPEDVLREVAKSYLERLLDPEALALYRVALGESAHVRDLGPALFAAGPKSAAAALSAQLRRWHDEGLLNVPDPDRTAAVFLGMVEGDLHRSAVLWASAPTIEAVDANVEAAVNLFLRGVARVRADLAA